MRRTESWLLAFLGTTFLAVVPSVARAEDDAETIAARHKIATEKYELGLMYFEQGKMALALSEFQRGARGR